MTENNPDLPSKLLKARQQLQDAQAQVADLEAQLFFEQPNSITRLTDLDRYRFTLDTMPQGCQIIGFDWRYLYVNDAAAKFIRQRKEDLLGHRIMEREPGIEATAMFAIMQRCMQQRIIERTDYEFADPDGTTAWFELNVQPVPEGILISSLDITKQKREQESLRRSEERFRFLVDQIEDYAIYLLDPNGYVMSWNVGAERLKGYRGDEVIGQHYSRFFTAQDQRDNKPQHLLDLVITQGSIEDEGWRVRKDGSRFWANVVITALRNTDGDLYGFAKITRDLTQRRRAEVNIRTLHRTLGVLSDINQAIVRIRHLPSLFEKACAIAVEKGTFRMAWIGLLEPTSKRITLAAHAGAADNFLGALHIDLSDAVQAQYPLVKALQAGKHWVCNDLEHDPQKLPWRDEALRLGYRAAVALPLMVAGKVRGVLSLYADEADFFNTEELRLMDEMAGDISLAIEIVEQDEQRSEAEAAVQRYAKRMEILHEIDLGIIRATSIPTIVEGTLKNLRQLISCQRVSVILFDWATNEWQIFADDSNRPYSLGREIRAPIPSGWDDGFGTETVRILDDLRLAHPQMPVYQPLIKDGLVSGIQALFVVQEQRIGLLGLNADSPGYFTAEHKEIAAGVANQLAIAIHQMYLDEALMHRAAELERNNADLRKAEAALKLYGQRMDILHELDTSLIQGSSIESVVETTLTHLRRLVPCQRADVMILDDSTGEAIVFAVAFDGDTKLGQGVRVPSPPTVFEGYDARHIRVFDDFRPLQDTMPRSRRLVNEGLLCALSVLLMDRDRPIGVLGLFADVPNFFTAEHQEIAIQIANQLTIAIRQLQLLHELAQHTQTVEEMRQFLQSTLDAFPANTTVLDPEGTILTVNLPWKTFADENDADATTHYLGGNYLTVCDTAVGAMSEYAAPVAAGIRAVLAGQQEEFTLEYPCDSPTEQRWFMIRATPFAEPVPRRAVVAHINITERKRAEQAEREQRLLAEVMRDSLAVLTASLDVETVMQQILAYSASVIPSEAGTIILFEGKQGRVAYSRGHSAEAEAYFKTNLISLDSGLYTKTYDNKAHYYAADTRATPNWVSVPVTTWVRSSIGVSIVIRGEPIGLLIADSAIPNRFQKKDLEHLQSFAQYAALALENAYHVDQLERRVTARTSELQATKERVEAILNNSTDGILLALPDLTIKQTNRAFNTLFACKTDDYLDLPLTTLFHEYKEEQIKEALRTGEAEGHVMNIDVRARRLDGTTFDAELSIGFIKKGGFVCSIRDITERKAQERQLRFHATLQENVADAVIVTDMEFRVQSWNKAAEHIYGWTAEEVLGKPSLDTLRSQDESEEERQYRIEEFLRLGVWKSEVLHQRKDGTGVYILANATILKDETGMPFGVVTVNHDITQRKAQERQLRYHASLQENVSDAVIVTDMAFRIQSWNKAAERIYGWRAAEVVDQSVADVLPTEYLSTIDQEGAIQQLREQGWWQGEVIQHHKDGSIRHILGSVSMVKDESGVPFGVVSVNHDITERKQVEEALHQSEERFALVFRLSPVAISLTTAAEGRYLDVNDSLLKLLGYARDEMIGRTSSELNVWETPDQRAAVVQAIRENGSVHGLEVGFRKKTDEIVRNTLTSIIPVILNGQSCLLAMIYDITERKAAEDALRNSEEKFRLLMDAAPVAIVITNQAGNITLINNRAEILFGYKRAELEGQLVDVLVPDYVRERHAGNRATYIASPHERQMGIGLELSAQRKDGSEFPVEIELSYIDTQSGLLVMGFVVDITERKQHAAAVEQQRAFLQQVIDVSPNMIFVKDYNAKFILINALVAKMNNTTVEAMLGRSDADFSSARSEIEAFLESDRRVIDSGIPLKIEELVTDWNGAMRWLQTTKVPVVSPDGKSKFVLGVSTDITVRKQAEQALRQAFEKEKELGELKSRFVSMASHEFRTPLATILALTETLSAYRHKLSEEQIDQRFGKIINQVDHLKDIMEDVLLLARMQARRVDFNPVMLDLDELCRNVLEEFQSRPDVTHHIDYLCKTPPREVSLDKKLMRQVISNLVSNAIKYSPKDKPIEVSLEFTRDSLILSVSDEGIGIPEADLQHLFEPFHRAANVGTISGTGLGLVITQESVELHHGQISVDSQIGVGTTFTVMIPLK